MCVPYIWEDAYLTHIVYPAQILTRGRHSANIGSAKEQMGSSTYVFSKWDFVFIPVEF